MVRRLLARVLGPLRDLDTRERLVLLGVVVVHVVGIGWGLPASDGWDVDGIAPRDFLPGVIATFTPGGYFTYPPLHLLVLSVLTLPVTLVTIVRAPSLAQHDVIQTFIQVPVMTAFAYVARVVSLLMSLGVVLAVGRMAAVVFGPRARVWAFAIAGVEVAGTYYAHTSNLDIPALFWGSQAILVLMEAVQADEPRRLRRAALLAACAIATKDQAYALFALSVPCVLAAWAVARYRAGTLRELVREGFTFAAIGLATVLLLDGALFNPTGFAARMRFLIGPASQDFAQYSRDWPGRFAALHDAVLFLPRHYPVMFAPVFALGAALAIVRTRGRERIVACIPLLAIASFTLAFNCVARRVEERFMLPQMQLLAVYGAGAIAALLAWAPVVRRRTLTWAVRGGAGACIGAGLHMSAGLLATMLHDARYDTERFLREQLRPGDVVETYGNNVYLPRFPEGAVVQRIDPSPTAKRNPMPGVVEIEGALSGASTRRPRFIVVSTGYSWRFGDPEPPRDGRTTPESVLRADTDSSSHMHALFFGTGDYRVTHISHYAGHPWLPPRAIHASVATDIWIFAAR